MLQHPNVGMQADLPSCYCQINRYCTAEQACMHAQPRSMRTLNELYRNLLVLWLLPEEDNASSCCTYKQQQRGNLHHDTCVSQDAKAPTIQQPKESLRDVSDG